MILFCTEELMRIPIPSALGGHSNHGCYDSNDQ